MDPKNLWILKTYGSYGSGTEKHKKRRGYLSEREEEAEAPRSIEGCLGLVLDPLHARRAVLQYRSLLTGQ